MSESPDFSQPRSKEPDAQLSRDQIRYLGTALELVWDVLSPCTAFPASHLEPGRCGVPNHPEVMQNPSRHRFIFHWMKFFQLSVDRQIPRKPAQSAKSYKYIHV